MKNVNFISCLFTFILLASLTSCQNEPELATITTSPIGSIANNSAVSGGYISDDGGADVTARGVVWNTSSSPTTANNSTNDGNGPGSFTSNLTGLTANTTYYVRSYAINSAGTAYGNQQSFTTTTTGSGIVSNPGAGVTYNGYAYSSVVLGNGQEWMSENLRTAKYRNGDSISTGLDNATWNSTYVGAYAIYNNDNSNDVIYGKLYNWFAVTDPRHICPTSWHEPTVDEWVTLINYLGGEAVAGGKMKTTGTQYWTSPNTDATNESGFSGLPGGYRPCDLSFPTFYQLGTNCTWWTSSLLQNNGAAAQSRTVYNYGGGISQVISNNFLKQNGFSVRCLRD